MKLLSTHYSSTKYMILIRLLDKGAF